MNDGIPNDPNRDAPAETTFEVADELDVADIETSPRARFSNPTAAALWRMRIPIAITAGIGLYEWLYIRFGSDVASFGLIALTVFPLGIWALTKMTKGAPGPLVASFVLLVVFVTTIVVSSPIMALGATSLVGLIIGAHHWRLKLRHLMVLLVLVAVCLRLGIAFGDSLVALLL